MVLGIVNKENVTLYLVVTFGLAFFALMFIPMESWTFVSEWILQTPLITIFGQSILFLVSTIVITIFLILIREVLS